MPKDALESLRKRHSKYVSDCYYRDWLLAVACVDEIAAALEQAWAERDDAILCSNGLRDDLCGLNDELLEERNVLQGRLAAVEAREFPNTITTLEQTTETLAANNVKYFNTIVALKEERDALKQALAVTQKNLDDTFGNMLEAQEERDALKRQHKDCLEQKEALRERCETLELGYRGVP